VGIVSALVCTRNRAGAVLTSIRSLLDAGDREIEVLVIDQSDGRETEETLAPLAAADTRLRYIRSSTRGKGAALNEGLRLARGWVLVCTDDDCVAPPGWVSAMADVMAGQPKAAIVFCNVAAPPYDEEAGYIPTYVRRDNRLVRTISDTIGGHGLGAGMALRRELILEFGGFDESMGPGARFASGDDWDITARALLRGWHVYETADLTVVHHGFRTLDEGRKHALRDWIAIGAVCAKPLRAGHWAAVIVPAWEFPAHALWPPLSDLLHGRRPRGYSRIVGFLRGFAQGLATPVDKDTLLFRPQRR
jgi:glycosyltransferase involved in cell wall biosynthesis